MSNTTPQNQETQGNQSINQDIRSALESAMSGRSVATTQEQTAQNETIKEKASPFDNEVTEPKQTPKTKEDEVKQQEDKNTDPNLSREETIANELAQVAENGMFTEEQLAKEKDEKKQIGYRTLNKKIKEYAKQNKELIDKIKELEGGTSPEVKKEYEGLKNKLSEKEDLLARYEKVLTLHKLEETQAYQNSVTEPLKELRSEVEKIARRYDLSPVEVFTALSDADRKDYEKNLGDMVVEMDHFDQLSLYDLSKQIKDVKKNESLFRENAKQALEMVQAKENERRTNEINENKSRWVKVADEVWNDKVAPNVKFLEIIDDEKFQNQVKEAEIFAKNLEPGKVTDEDLLKALHYGALAPSLIQLIGYLSNHANSLQKRLQARKDVTPSFSPNQQGAPEPKVDDSLGFVGALQQKIRST